MEKISLFHEECLVAGVSAIKTNRKNPYESRLYRARKEFINNYTTGVSRIESFRYAMLRAACHDLQDYAIAMKAIRKKLQQHS